MSIEFPLVTIAIPFFNPGSYIIDTLESVYNQNYFNIELILYNDGSTDESYDLVLEWTEHKKNRFSRLELINEQENRGVGYACVVLLGKSYGCYFQMLGADDLLYPEKIYAQVQILNNNSDYAMIYGNMDRIDDEGIKFEEEYFSYQNFFTFDKAKPVSGNLFNQLIQENFIPASSVLVRKSAIEEVGGYDAALKSEDWDLWLRIAERYKIIGANMIFGAYRILPTSAMHSSKNKIFVLESLNEALVKHKGSSKEIDAIIEEHLYKHTVEMYRLGHISKKWANRLYTYKPGLKPIIYYLFMKMGIKVNQKR